jgi:hypothetical protein
LLGDFAIQVPDDRSGSQPCEAMGGGTTDAASGAGHDSRSTVEGKFVPVVFTRHQRCP